MPKYRVYSIATASWPIGEYEAENAEAAEKMAEEDGRADWYRALCHQCSDEVELGDGYETQVEEIDPK